MQQHSPVLVVTPTIPAARLDGQLLLDDKAVSGLNEFARHWPGPVRCIFREGPPSSLVFATPRDAKSLPFDIHLIPDRSAIPNHLVEDASLVMASAENYLDLPLADTCGQLGVPVIYIIENTLRTRLRILALEGRPLTARLKSAVWTVMTEKKRRAAFTRSSGIAANGVPASRSYSGLCKDVLTFFDTRMPRTIMASSSELQAKQARLLRGEPLRLGFSGRLEAIKGADHLVPLARHLEAAGLDFSLDIFGAGSLEPRMREQLQSTQLNRRITLHGPVDFEARLVPYFRTNIDLFVCCHRQSDPSCTYMETMGCAVPIAGYANQALRGLLELAHAGIATPMDDPAELARMIVALSRDRQALSRMMRSALELSAEHDFERTFSRRIQQCLRVAQGAQVKRTASALAIPERG
jgi:colanic acid/amylovoran biosynthesis glycosyltransferase